MRDKTKVAKEPDKAQHNDPAVNNTMPKRYMRLKQLERVDNPNGIGRRHLQLVGNGRQRHVANRPVNDRQEQAGQDGGHRIIYPGAVQPVPCQVARHAGSFLREVHIFHVKSTYIIDIRTKM